MPPADFVPPAALTRLSVKVFVCGSMDADVLASNVRPVFNVVDVADFAEP
jgi:hypothetical protein